MVVPWWFTMIQSKKTTLNKSLVQIASGNKKVSWTKSRVLLFGLMDDRTSCQVPGIKVLVPLPKNSRTAVFTLSICISFCWGRPDSFQKNNNSCTIAGYKKHLKSTLLFNLSWETSLVGDDFFRWGCSHEWIHSLKLTASSHLKMDGWKMKSPFGMAYFLGLC